MMKNNDSFDRLDQELKLKQMTEYWFWKIFDERKLLDLRLKFSTDEFELIEPSRLHVWYASASIKFKLLLRC